jgi:hypothetical protein
MPMVGGKKYAYTKDGMKKAKDASKKTGQPMKMKKGKTKK